MPVIDTVKEEQFITTDLAKEIHLNDQDINSSLFLSFHRRNLKKIRWQTNLIPNFDTMSKQDQHLLENWHLGLVYSSTIEIEMRKSVYYKSNTHADKLLHCVENFETDQELVSLSKDVTISFVFVLTNDMKSVVFQPYLEGQLEVKQIGSDCNPDHPILQTFYNESLVGSRFAKYFLNNDLFFGTIDAYDKEKKLWHVKYDDNDHDENDFREMKDGLDLYYLNVENDPTKFIQIEENVDDYDVCHRADNIDARDVVEDRVSNENDHISFSQDDTAAQNNSKQSLELEDATSYNDYKGRYIRSEEYSGPIEVEEEKLPEDSLSFCEKFTEILRQSKISRDIDSIAILGNNIASVMDILEDKSILKLSQLISDTPTTSSRHAIRLKVRTRRGTSSIKTIPLHRFQNITLGTVTAGNVRFHVNFYCLNTEEVQKEKNNWRPFTTCRRLVVAAAMNLARLLQSEMLKIIAAEVMLIPEDNSDKAVIQMLLEERYQSRFFMSSRHTQHWVSSGEWFFINREGTNRSEVSSCTADAIPFLRDFMLALQLISHGLLSLNAIWTWCVAPFDTTRNADGSSITPIDMQIQCRILFEYKYFVLTAAGVKHDFSKYPPFMTKDNVLTDDDVKELQTSQNVLDFNHWIQSAGRHNMRNVLKCFKKERSVEECKDVIVTVDDGLNITPLQETQAMFLPVANNKLTAELLRQCVIDELESDMVVSGEVDNLDDVENEDGHDDDEEQEYENEEIENEEIENEEIENNDNEDTDIKLSATFTLIDKLLQVPCIRPSTVNRYSVFNCPLSECEHTGHIPFRMLDVNNTCQLVTMTASNDIIRNGTLLGAQKYVTSAKSMKYSNCLKSLSTLQNMDRATFGLLHGPVNLSTSHVKHLGKCLSVLNHIDYSNDVLKEMISRKSCLRLECFRLLSMNDGNDTIESSAHEDIIKSFQDYPLDVLEMPVWIQNKSNFLQNYCGVLRKAKSTLISVFQSVVGMTSNTPRKGSDISNHPRLLSREAKMVVQFCSELLSFELGTRSGYSSRGPISIAMMEKFVHGYQLHFLSDESDSCVKQICDAEKRIIGFEHGIDPSIWNFNDQAGKTIGQIVSEVLDVQEDSQETSEKPRLSAALVRKTQVQLRSKLFRYQKNNKEKDLYSWLLFVSEFIMVRINQKQRNSCGSAFDAINHQAFSHVALNNRHEFQEIIDGLADIFWICYEWEWQSDILHGLKLDSNWPRTKSEAIQTDQVLALLDSRSSTRLTPAKGRGNKKDISVKSIGKYYRKVITFDLRHCERLIISILDDLSQTIFQNLHEGQDNSVPSRSKTKNWDSTIYLNLFKYIASELTEARKNTSRDLGNYSYLLTQDFFLARIACRLITTDHSHNHDPPILWKTVKSNRLKDRGAYVEVNRMALFAAANEKIEHLKNHGVSFLNDYEDSLPPKISKTLNTVLSRVCLSKALTSLPFPLNGMNKTQRIGGKIGFGKILLMAIFTQVGETQLEDIGSVDPEKVWRIICGDYRSLNQTISNIQRSQVYKLWNTFGIFNERWKLLLTSMHNISIGKKYMWKEIKKAVQQVSFYNTDQSNPSTKPTCLKTSLDLSPPYIIDAQFVADLKTLSRAYVHCMSKYGSRYYARDSRWSNSGDFVLHLLHSYRKSLKRDS